MKSAIIYFSQTETQKKIAKRIQQGVIQEAGNCELIKMRDVDRNTFTSMI